MRLSGDRRATCNIPDPGPRPGPPSFAEARTRHQKVRAAGLHPDYWYPVEYDDRLKPGQVTEVRFWGQSIALYRAADERVAALENRCAHRHLPLSLGDVTSAGLRCLYHGWSYGSDGWLSNIPHDLFGRPMPTTQLATFPVRVRYGLIWLFPGNPALAEQQAIPDIPELEGPQRWAYVPIDFTWRTHHSLVMDNLCDLTHAHLHRSFPSFLPGRLLSVESGEGRVLMRYEARVGPFAHVRSSQPRTLEIAYDYPYHRARFQFSNIDGGIAYWTFLLPQDERSTRVFFVFCYDRLQLQRVPVRLGHGVIRTILRLVKPSVRRLLEQDGLALEAEQAGWDRHFQQPILDLNPVVAHVERLTIARWEGHLGLSSRAEDQHRSAAASRSSSPMRPRRNP